MTRYRLVRRTALTAVMGVVLYNVGGADFVRQAYPADPFKSEALANCAASDPSFVRYFPTARARCYARQPRLMRSLQPLASTGAETVAEAGSSKPVIR